MFDSFLIIILVLLSFDWKIFFIATSYVLCNLDITKGQGPGKIIFNMITFHYIEVLFLSFYYCWHKDYRYMKDSVIWTLIKTRFHCNCNHYLLCTQVMSAYEPSGSLGWSLSWSQYCSMKHLGVILYLPPLDGMLVDRSVSHSIKFAGIHLCTWVETGTVRVNCLA